MARRRRIVAGLAAALAAGVTSVAPVGATPSPVNVGGGGATFLANMMDVCRALYNSNTASNPGKDVVTYASVGSGSGKSGFRTGTYDFGGTESAYGATETKPSNFVYVPLVGGPIAIGYRIDGTAPAGAQIKLTGELVAKIFAAQITNWNDPAIAAVNKATAVALKASVAANGVTVKSTVRGTNVTFTATMTPAALKRFKGKKITVTPVTDGTAGTPVMDAGARKSVTKLVILAEKTSYEVKAGTRVIGTLVPKAYTLGVDVTFPSLQIKVAYRQGNSGTTNNFANYLNKEFPTIWTKATSDAFTTAFPGTMPTDGTFQAAQGNDGVSNQVRDNNGTVTYAELSFLTERNISYAKVSNAVGKYVAPSPESSAKNLAAADVATDGVTTLNYKATDAASYPINAISYGLASTAASAKATAVKSYFTYFLNKCAPTQAAPTGYTALTGEILTKALAQVAKIGAG